MILETITKLTGIWPEVAVAVHTLVALIASSHAVLTKDDSKVAVGWIGTIWLSPLLGALLYYAFGINRIRRRAITVMGRPEKDVVDQERGAKLLAEAGVDGANLLPLIHLGDGVGGLPMTRGNKIEPLVNGDQAFPAMLEAIRGARRSIMMSSYIFDNDDAGKEFVKALGDAKERGVEVRVLVDATGSRYSFPSIVLPLKRVGVRVARFMPNFRLRRVSAFNLRSHRKILVVDGKVGFTGGINIREANYLVRPHRKPIQDLHFRIEGPVVAHLRQAFVEDWIFTTKEALTGDAWATEEATVGEVLARGVLDGPDKDFEKTLWTLLGAVAAARTSIKIVTPYFLPEPTMIRFLSVAALSGISVDIVLPEDNNIILVQWASIGTVAPLLKQNCRIYLSPPPFDHSKMMIVDDAWVFLGSANWDARSLRLNFEFNIECFSKKLATSLGEIFEKKRAGARRLTLHEVETRSFPRKLRDAVTRLLAPYL